MEISPIRDEASYERALAEVHRLWGAEIGTEEGNRLDVLMVLVDDYENRHHAIEAPHPIEAIRIRMEQMGLDRADLGEMLGIRSGRVSEILNCQRRLTIDMIRTLAEELKLSERCLLQPYALTSAPDGAPREGHARTKVAA
jgi:HTH-type transcriptional regulator/antitoxin HigA